MTKIRFDIDQNSPPAWVGTAAKVLRVTLQVPILTSSSLTAILIVISFPVVGGCVTGKGGLLHGLSLVVSSYGFDVAKRMRVISLAAWPVVSTRSPNTYDDLTSHDQRQPYQAKYPEHVQTKPNQCRRLGNLFRGGRVWFLSDDDDGKVGLVAWVAIVAVFGVVGRHFESLTLAAKEDWRVLMSIEV